MLRVPIGLLLALAAAVFSGSGSILQDTAVVRAHAKDTAGDGLRRVVRQKWYWYGMGSDILGFVCAAAALQRLPLFAVQATVATSVGVTALIATIMGHRLSRIKWGAIGAAGIGLVLLGFAASATPATVHHGSWRWYLFLGVGASMATGFMGWRAKHGAAPLMGLAAGLGYATVAISARSLKVPHNPVLLLADPGVWAMICGGILGAVWFACALQRGAVTVIAAVTFTTQIIVPSIIGIALLGDTVREGFTFVAVCGYALAVGGAFVLAARRRRKTSSTPPETPPSWLDSVDTPAEPLPAPPTDAVAHPCDTTGTSN